MRYALASFAGAAILSCTGAAAAGLRVNPNVDLRQIASRSPYQDDDVVTYTEAAVGLDGTVDTRRVKASFSYQYARRFGSQGGDLNDKDRHNAFARADVDLVDNRLSVSFGAYAALLNRDYRGDVSFSPDQLNANLTQTWSIYAAPSYHQPFDFGELDLNYRIGATNVAGGTGAQSSTVPGGTAADVGISGVGSSVNQTLTARFGNREQSSRLRWDLIGTASTEDGDRLDQRYRAYDGRFEVEYAIRRGIGIFGNVGYERTRSSQLDIQRDASGFPVTDPDTGEFILDPNGARRETYAQRGLSFEGGVRLQPNRRTLLNVRAGRRFGSFTVNGEGRWEVTPRLVLTGRIVEGVDSFGRLLTRDLDGIRVNSIVGNAQAAGLGVLNGCIFGTDPGTGACLFNATQSITAATFRNRSAQGIVDFRRRRTSTSIAFIYSKRSFLDTDQLQAPGTAPVDGSFNGGSDISMTLNAQVSQALRGGQSVSLGAFASRYKFALSSARRDYYLGGTGGYTVALGRKLAGTVSATVSRRYSDIAPRVTDATASAGLRYQF